ncbi:propionyl-CoA synthetase [Nocardioides sp. HDW12B]|uniref:propionyl-CoA synthetase n=1 Tax=Nocardioides sp. HDW12B TaxID=2714939 RepID=UPI00140C2A83|nr:propionyl-CoA synthetase [Nocardioides sp. HDW12B]QIK66961.1 propionyl-CoA synthetase [Nocardioides sp. HDW12B]
MSAHGSYAETHARSIADPESFWLEQARLVDWFAKPTRALDADRPPFYRWFPDATMNTCYNALDRHVVNGRADQVALIHDSPVTGTRSSYTYARLLEKTAAFAGVLQACGVQKGDRVIVYMPMIPEAVIAMLACARLGAVHSVVFGGFAAKELAARVDDARPKVVVMASCGVEPARVVEYKPLLDRALELAEHQPEAVIVKQRPQGEAELREGRDLDWDVVMRHGANDPAGCVEVAATDPLYVLYTSGTTGKPKGIVRDNGGHAVALAWSLPNIYDVRAGQVFWAASDVGWVVGHSYIVYAPLICGATTVLYEGKPVGTPDAGAFWRVIADHRVEALFTAPTAIRAVKKEDPEGRLLADHDTSSLRTLFLAGERLDPDTYTWATERLGVPVVDNWWQTETGWPIAANLRGLEPMEIKPGSPSVPVPGYDVQVLDPTGRQVPAGEEGAICLKLPLPPGTLPTVWGDDERFVSSYLSAFDGYYMSGDGGYVDEDGYVFVMGRTDDVINVAGHRLSTGSMEAVIASHPAVAECAVIGVAEPTKGQVPRGFVVLKSGVTQDPDEIARELVAMVRDEVGPVAAFRDVAVVPALPKTRSGKILRKTMREIADGKDAVPPSTIEDPAVLDTLRPALRS